MAVSLIVLGISLALLGLAVSGLVLVAVRAIHWRAAPQFQPGASAGMAPPLTLDIDEHDEAVVLVEAGGRVAYLNEQARRWFRLGSEEPDLEQLGQQAQPGDTFLALCARQAQASFYLDGRLMEGTSYYVPYGSGRAMLVSMRPPKWFANDQAEFSELGLNLFAGLSQKMSASLDLEKTLFAVLESVEELAPADRVEIGIWDAERSAFRVYRLTGLMGTERSLSTGEVPGVQKCDEPGRELWIASLGFAGRLLETGKPLLVEDLGNGNDLASPKLFRAYLGAPLVAGGKPFGVLELASFTSGVFSSGNLEIIGLLAPQAAVSLHNALLYEDEQQRIRELAGLAELAQAAEAQNDPQHLFTRLVESIAPLLNVEVCGFLLYDENRNVLVRKVPFAGLPDNLTQWELPEIAAGAEAEEILSSGEAILALDAPGDQRLAILGLQHLATAAGIKTCVLAPLTSSGRLSGYLMAADKKDGVSFTPGDLRLLAIIAGQVAPVIDNSTLIVQSQRRAQRAETLRRVASLTASTASLDEILKYSLHDLSQLRGDLSPLRGACFASISLLDEDRGELCPHAPSLIGISPEIANRLLRLGVESPQFSDTAAGSQRLYVTGQLAMDTGDPSDLPPFYCSLFQALGLQSAVVAPLVVWEHSLGELILGSEQSDLFTPEDVQAISTAAGQLAGAVERTLLYSQTDESLRQRVEQLTSLTRASRELNGWLGDELFQQPWHGSNESFQQRLNKSSEHMLQRVYAELIQMTHADCGTILLFELGESDFRSGIPPRVVLRLGDSPSTGLGRLEQFVLESGTSLVIDDFEDSQFSPAQQGVRSALIVPIVYQEQVAGLIHLHSGEPHHFDGMARNIADTLAIQAAIVLANAHRYQEQLQRGELLNDRLERLTRLLDTFQSMRLDQPLDNDLNESLQYLNLRKRWIEACLEIIDLMHSQPDRNTVMEVLGREMLAGFDLDSVVIAEGSAGTPRLLSIQGSVPSGVQPESLLGLRNPLLHCLQNREMILVSRLEPEDEWSSSPLLSALEARSLVCFPITPLTEVETRHPGSQVSRGASDSGGDAAYAVLGISRRHLSLFTPDDEALFTRLSQGAAMALQNLSLISSANRRLEEVRLLLDFTRQLGNAGPLRLNGGGTTGMVGLFQALAESALHLLPAAQGAAVYVRENGREALVPKVALGYVDDFQMLGVCQLPGETPAGLAFTLREPVCLKEVDFARQYRLSGDDLLRYHAAVGGKLPISCLAVPIGSSKRPETELSGVLLLENFKAAEAFDANAQALVVSLAGQAGLILENAGLYRASEQRAAQLQALARAAAVLTATLEPESLASELLDQLEPVLPYDTGTLWLRQGKTMVVRATRGFADGDERIGLTVALEDSALLNEMAQTCQPIAIGDVGQDERFSALFENTNRSWLGVPLIAGREVIGVIALEKAEADAYPLEQVLIATTFAGQAAVAVENAFLYQESLSRTQELDERSHRLALLNQFSSELSATLDLDRILDCTLRNLLKVEDCSFTAAVLFDREGRASLWAEAGEEEPLHAAGDDVLTPELPMALPEVPLFDRLRQTLGIFQTEDAVGELELHPLSAYLAERLAGALLALPLATGNDVHGVLLALSRTARRFSAEEVGLARTIANQAAVGVQNAKLYAQTRSLSEDLERRVKERTAQLGQEHHRTQILLKIITELSASLDLEQVLNRTLKVLNEIVDAEHISVMILQPGQNRLYHLASLGYATVPPAADRVVDLGAGGGLAGWVISHRRAALIADVRSDPRWTPIPAARPEYALNHHSAIGVPLMGGAEILGALLFFHTEPDHFSFDQLDLVEAVARQVGVAVNNAELYRLIRDQAEDLGGMLRRQQVETSQTRSILEAVADGVLVTDAEGKITMFNASAELILGLDRGQVIGKTLADFPGLFGRSAQAWAETINAWSQDPSAYGPGELYAEQIVLDTGRVVSVHLAPVQFRNGHGSAGDFTGTVSIFRDITHQVEVDRLKSEFVATVSHELRTPMTSIKGYVDVLLMGAAGPMSDQQRRFLDIVKNNTERLGVLVNDLLDISQIESGRETLSLQPFDLESLMVDRAAELRRRSHESGKLITLEIVAAPCLPKAYGDPERVRQVIDNLLENAFLYTPEGGGVNLRIYTEGTYLRVDVQDTGIGIPVELQSRVFERFYRGENPFVLASPGTGLGLAIVKRLVEMHGGRIWLESSGRPGEGSTFSFTLPVYDENSDELFQQAHNDSVDSFQQDRNESTPILIRSN